MSEQEKKEQNYIAKVPDKKIMSAKPMKGAPAAKKFKGKPDLRNNNSKGTNGMHNNTPLTKEHQIVLGDGETKATPSNPRGYSKRQLSFLSFLRERDGKANTNQSNVDGHFSSWGNEKNSFRGIENNYMNGFTLNMFQPAGEGTPSRASNRDELDDSTIIRRAERDIKRIAGEVRAEDIAVHSNTMHINSIGKKLAFDGRLRPWGTSESNVINMIGWQTCQKDSTRDPMR